MSEHRRGSAKVVPFPEAEEVLRPWPNLEMREIIDHAKEYIEAGIDLIEMQHDSFLMLELYHAGLEPERADALIEFLRPRWAQLIALMNANRERAKAMLQRKEARKCQ